MLSRVFQSFDTSREVIGLWSMFGLCVSREVTLDSSTRASMASLPCQIESVYGCRDWRCFQEKAPAMNVRQESY